MSACQRLLGAIDTAERKTRLRTIFTVVAVLLTNACAHDFRSASQTVPPHNIQHESFDYREDSADRQRKQHEQAQRHYLSAGKNNLHKRLDDYADQLAMSLVNKAFSLKQSDKIAVASFVRFNASLREPTVFGNRLAEALMSQLQTYGLSLVDTKLTTQLAITHNGDLALSRDKHLLKSKQNIDYILTGTLVERSNGIEVNARIVGVEANTVAAASSLFIPGFIVANEERYSVGH